MKQTTFDHLQINAVLKFLRPVPGYMEIDTELTVRAFVEGGCPIEEELRGLEAFRKTLIKLTTEGLSHPPNCGPAGAPWVALTLTAEEEGSMKPDREFAVALELEPMGNFDIWVLRWDNDAGFHVRLMFLDVCRALDILKCLLDKKTGDWASLVPFENGRVDS